MYVIRMFLSCIMTFIVVFIDDNGVYNVISLLKIIFGKIYPLEMLFLGFVLGYASHTFRNKKKKQPSATNPRCVSMRHVMSNFRTLKIVLTIL